MFGKVSLASLGLVLGSLLTVTGFVAYALDYATLNLAGFFYGIPLLLGGLALKAAELKPIPYSAVTEPDILRLRETQATPTQNQIRKDVTRYRYGQEAHLDEALQRLGLSPTDEERPVLTAIRETALDGQYSLVLEFDSLYISLEQWREKQEKIAKFFGPGIKVVLTPKGEKALEAALVTDDSYSDNS